MRRHLYRRVRKVSTATSQSIAHVAALPVTQPRPQASSHSWPIAWYPLGQVVPQVVNERPQLGAQWTWLPVTQPRPHASLHDQPVG
jgi:hypothetical protein